MMMRTMLAAQTRTLGAENPDTLATACSVAHSLCCQKRHADAEKMIRDALAVHRRVFGERHAKAPAICRPFIVRRAAFRRGAVRCSAWQARLAGCTLGRLRTARGLTWWCRVVGCAEQARTTPTRSTA